ncbi:hypothetical protein [Shinella sp. BYT-45]|uniref:hypothetical protein n=1 Tax=Shinella sp. BYT-45 TaxID=3377377 RepID=UPI00397FC019
MAAFALAILLALQSLLGSFAMAAGTGTPMVDAFGNPLCIGGMEGHEPASAPDKDHSRHQECCTLACGMAHGFAPTDRAVAILFNPLAQPSQRILEARFDQVRPALDNLPGNPRAPPFAA